MTKTNETIEPKYSSVKEFHKWIKETFTWVEPDAKRLMQRAWNASQKSLKTKN